MQFAAKGGELRNTANTLADISPENLIWMPFVNMTLVPQDVVFLPTTSSCKSFFPNIEDGNENVSESGFIGIC